MTNIHSHIDRFKLRLAKAVLEDAKFSFIRDVSIENLNRWKEKGVWCSAYDEWFEIMTSDDDDKILHVMTSQDEVSNRLRQSPPYIGIVDEVTRAYLWETRAVEDDLNLSSEFRIVDEKKIKLCENLLLRFSNDVIRQKGLSFLSRLRNASGSLNSTHLEWQEVLSSHSSDEFTAIMLGSTDKAVRMRLVHPFDDLV